MDKVSIIGLDLAKRAFQAHGARADGGVAFRKKLLREKVLSFMAEQAPCEAARGSMSRRLQTVPDVGPITAMAIETFAPPMFIFKRGRDFAAWLGLVPRQHSTG